MLPDRALEQPEDFSELMADLDRVVVPGLVGWQHPGFFAYFPGNISPPSVLAEMVTASLGQQGMMWSTSPAATEVEMKVLDWLVDLLGLPQEWKMAGPGGGVIRLSASDATDTALAVARYRAQEENALDDLVAYVSSQAHSSIEKGARVAGFRLSGRTHFHFNCSSGSEMGDQRCRRPCSKLTFVCFVGDHRHRRQSGGGDRHQSGLETGPRASR